MREQLAFAQFGAAARRIGALALCLALCALGPGLSANAQDRQATIITFDAPGSIEGTFPQGITPAGAITGFYFDAIGAFHGFLRARDGTFTLFDAPGAGTGHFRAPPPDRKSVV